MCPLMLLVVFVVSFTSRDVHWGVGGKISKSDTSCSRLGRDLSIYPEPIFCSHSIAIIVHQTREVRQCGWRKFISTVVDSVYPRPSVLLCMCLHSGTSHCSACSYVTSAWYEQTWSVYLFHYPDRSFLIVCKATSYFHQINTPKLPWKTKNLSLYIIVCFSISFSSFRVNLFFTKLVLLTRALVLSLYPCGSFFKNPSQTFLTMAVLSTEEL